MTVETLAMQYLDIPTLEPRRADGYDFYEVGVGSMRALVAAAGAQTGRVFTEDEVSALLTMHFAWNNPVVQGRDFLDFREVAVWEVKALLESI